MSGKKSTKGKRKDPIFAVPSLKTLADTFTIPAATLTSVPVAAAEPAP
jgi:hypothetical protein